MKKRIGLFGGRRGLAYYLPFSTMPDIEVVGFCEANEDLWPQIRQTVPESVPIVRTFEELLALKPDAVVLANFFHEHAKYAIMAMEAGVDVISETTAAPTAGGCLDLVETAERTGRKYMLAANCPTMAGPAELAKRYKSGELGEVYYAEAEYLHSLDPNDPEIANTIYPGERHWRRYLPTPYYNMHTLGVLMAATGLRPCRVTAMDIQTSSMEKKFGSFHCHAAGGVALYEMSNGAVFRSTGWCNFGPDGKWFRLTCEKGTVETTRLDQDRVILRKIGEESREYAPDHGYGEDEKRFGHGGADYRTCLAARDYLFGTGDPIMDVYQAVELSLAGIFGLYSILDGKTYTIPDPRDRAAREILRNDRRDPFPDSTGAATLPSSRR